LVHGAKKRKAMTSKQPDREPDIAWFWLVHRRMWPILGLVNLGLLAACSAAVIVAQTQVHAGDQPPDPQSAAIRAAVDRALPLLKTASAVEYPKHRDCFSCHNQGVPAVALALAKGRGFGVEAQTLRSIAGLTADDLESAFDEYASGKGQPGGVIRAGYALWTLDVAGWKADEITAAVAHYLGVADRTRGHWRSGSGRPPSENSEFTATFLALRGLQAFGGQASDSKRAKEPEPEIAERSRRALAWLKTARPHETEDRVFRLWAMKTAGASADELRAAASELLKTQRGDGGFSQLDESQKGKEPGRARELESDAYATGSALMALHLAGGLATDDPAYRRGLAYLISSQRADGSWLVKSRSKPFQPYFESGFPHGGDQFISAAATAWAVGALVLACPAS
jgi:hypothetical protein